MEPHSNKGGVPTYLERTQMLKKTITYVDYNDNERTETFYFNLNETELTEMVLSKEGGLEKYIQKIVDAQDAKELVSLFKTIILFAYGEKSADGKRFVKSKELSEAFSQTEAYNKLFKELSTNTDEAVAFINGIVPQVKTS